MTGRTARVLPLLGALACALPLESGAPEAPAPATLRVEVNGGLAVQAPGAVEPAVPVEIILDATLSMETPVSAGVSRIAAARQLERKENLDLIRSQAEKLLGRPTRIKIENGANTAPATGKPKPESARTGT